MRWIRRHIRSGSWLALTALAIHLVLTFGHVHAEELSPASMAAPTAAADAQAPGHGAPASGVAERHRTLRAHHFCAVCASISLLGTSVPPVALTLTPPRAMTAVRRPAVPDAAPLHELRSSFQARAPPSA
jgi:hypothetical protein